MTMASKHLSVDQVRNVDDLAPTRVGRRATVVWDVFRPKTPAVKRRV